jgi:hypothetical protein
MRAEPKLSALKKKKKNRDVKKKKCEEFCAGVSDLVIVRGASSSFVSQIDPTKFAASFFRGAEVGKLRQRGVPGALAAARELSRHSNRRHLRSALLWGVVPLLNLLWGVRGERSLVLRISGGRHFEIV